MPQHLDGDYMKYVNEEMTIVKKITIHNPIEVNNPKVSIQWMDEDRHTHTMTTSSIYGLVQIFEHFPRVAEALWLAKKHIKKLRALINGQ